MKFANHDGRLTLIDRGSEGELQGARGIDVNRASGGRIPAEPERALELWDDVVAWVGQRGQPGHATDAEAGVITIDARRLGSPTPKPQQIFGIGLNYADHGTEANMQLPEVPLIFTKLSTAVTGPFDPIEITTESVDWEVEIAVVIGASAQHVPAADAWSVVAGVTAGQALSERDIQWRPRETPQFGLGKSLPGFAPLGPLLVTPDEYPDPDDIELSCRLNGEEMQRSRSAEMLFSVSEIIAYLSAITPLLPGDVLFTGTPAGIGMTRTPPRYLAPGDRLESWVQGAGTMSHTLVSSSDRAPSLNES